MKALIRIMTPTLLLVTMCVVDIPLLPIDLVPEAEAIFGVRRRTAVVAYSAGKSSAAASQQQAAAAQQQAAYSQQQAAAAEQEAAMAKQHSSGVPTGTVLEKLPGGCIPITVGDTQYQKCSETFYRVAFMGNKVVYVAVESPF